MNTKQTIAVVLIVLALIFSAVSLYIGSNSVDDASDDVASVSNNVNPGGASIGIVVEPSPESAG